jgi:hypothetical protein
MKFLLIINLLLFNLVFYTCFAQNAKVEKEGITFYLKNNEKKIYLNVLSEGEDLKEHELLEEWNDVGFWTLRIQYYEDIKYFIVNQQDGKEIEINGSPKISNDNTYFACLLGELEDPLYKNYSFEIFRFQGNDIQIVGSGRFENQFIQDFSWEENELILYLVSTEDESTEEYRWKNP